MDELHVCHLGEVEYREGVALQERVRTRVQEGELPGVLLLLEHPPVYTRGRRSEPGEIPMGEAWYRSHFPTQRHREALEKRHGGPVRGAHQPTAHPPGVRELDVRQGAAEG